MGKLVDDELLAYFKVKMDASVDDKIAKAMPYIGDNGNLIINGVDSGISAEIATIQSSRIQTLFS